MRGGCAKIVMKLSSWARTRELRGWGRESCLLTSTMVTGDLLSWGGSRFCTGSSLLGTTSVLSLTSLSLSPYHF